MFSQYNMKFYNLRIILYLIAISSIGVHLVDRAMSSLTNKQIFGVIIGIVLMLFVSFIDYSWILNFHWMIYIFNIAMLLAVYIFGESTNGAARWISIGSLRFQPTELSKILLILFFGNFFMDHEDKLNSPSTMIKSLCYLFIPLFMILKQPDLKNTITIVVLYCIMYFVAGLSYKVILGVFMVMVPTAVIFLSIVVQPDQKLIEDYQRDRIMSFLYPENEEYSDDIEQQRNSKTAIASGELLGRRLGGYTEVSSVNEGNFVPENQTDFIFAVAGEQYGFAGCCLIISLLLFISLECVRMGRRAKDLAGRIICCGVGSVVAFQSFLNIAVATGIAPNTGTPLPFVSYGLTSLISLYIGMGLVLNIGLQSSSFHETLRQERYRPMEEYL